MEKLIFDINIKFEKVSSTTSELVSYFEIEIDSQIRCEKTLDVVKSLTDFEGKHESYDSWRHAVHTAYE